MGLAAATMVLPDAGNVLFSVRPRPFTRSRPPLSIQGGRVRRLPLRRIRNWPNGALPARPSGHPGHERVLQLHDGEHRARIRRGICPCRRRAHSFELMALGALGTKPGFPVHPQPDAPAPCDHGENFA